MVTVEAEREKVNVNLNPHDQAGGGTGFPKLERNSIDNRFSTESGTRLQRQPITEKYGWGRERKELRFLQPSKRVS